MKLRFAMIIAILSIAARASESNPADQASANDIVNDNVKSTINIFASWSYGGITINHANQILYTLSKEKYFPYQDIYINGQTLWRGLGTDCSSRYIATRMALNRHFKRPFTFLDIGANNGYFSLRLARDCGAQCVMADMSDRLKNICEYNTDVANKIIYLKKQLSTQDLQAMKQQGIHFDAVMALHVLHHIPDWKDFKFAMEDIADLAIIETPPANDPRLEIAQKITIPAIEKELMDNGGAIIAHTPRTIPGYYQSLQKMEYNVNHHVPVDQNVKSKMFVLANQMPKNSAFKRIDMNILKNYNISFPH